MKVGDKITTDEFPGSIATITRFQMIRKSKGNGKEEIRTAYKAKFDGTGLEFQFYGFDIGRKIHPVQKEEEYHQISLFELMEN